MPHPEIDQDAMDAALELVGRTGAQNIQIGYPDDVPEDNPGSTWYARAEFRKGQVHMANHPGPVEALEALARRLMQGGMCTHCGKTITLSDPQEPTGTVEFCRWTRQGAHWVRGCTATHTERKYEPKERP